MSISPNSIWDVTGPAEHQQTHKTHQSARRAAPRTQSSRRY